MREDKKKRFDYFYGRMAEYYQFFRVPKMLVTDRRYRKVSRDAKLLYGLLLDRASLSYKNGWIDEEGRVYIIYPIKEIMVDLCCSNKTAVGFLAELDDEKGIGLIEKVRKGQGEKSWIYVKDFTTDAVISEESAEEDTDLEKEEACVKDVKDPSETLENTEKCKNYTSRSVKTTLQEVYFLHDNSNTNINKTDKVILSQSSSAQENDDDINKVIEETSRLIFDRTGLTYDSDKTPDRTYREERHLIADVIKAILREDIRSGHKDRVNLLLQADKQDVETVCVKLSRYGRSAQNPLKYAETVLVNALTERSLTDNTNRKCRTTKKPAVKSARFPERNYTPEEYDDIERKLLRASGYDNNIM